MRSSAEAVSTRARCTRWSSGSASATATCRREASAATPTSRCGGPGAPFGTRREIKNLNSFRFMQQAIDYEVQWQIDLIEDGGSVRQATVLFDAEHGETRAMRSKEDAHDYRYFPDPDLPPLAIGADWIERVRAAMPELPRDRAKRFQSQYSLRAYDAAAMTQSLTTADYFEAVASASREPKLAANWIMGEITRRLNAAGSDDITLAPATLAALIARVADRTTHNAAAKQLFDALWDGEGRDVDALIDSRGLRQLRDAGELERIVDDVIAASPKSVAEFRAGKEKAFNALVGQAMKASRGKADPTEVGALLRRSSAELRPQRLRGGLARGVGGARTDGRRRRRRLGRHCCQLRQRPERAGLRAAPQLLQAHELGVVERIDAVGLGDLGLGQRPLCFEQGIVRVDLLRELGRQRLVDLFVL